MVDARGRADKIVQIEDRNAALDVAQADTSQFQVGLIHEAGMEGAGHELVRRKPGFNYKEATGGEVASHARDGRLESIEGASRPDCASQASDNVKGPAQVEVRHIAQVQGHARKPALRY